MSSQCGTAEIHIQIYHSVT